ncbi:MAG: alginate lyase family protein, partial [Bacteroidota bacterium]
MEAVRDLILTTSLPLATRCLGPRYFRFLHIEHAFSGPIDWNYAAYGKLWTYNLNYFEFLAQEGMTKEHGVDLIHHFIEQEHTIKDGNEPFPTSLRIINWIKFIIREDIQDLRIDESLYRQVGQLSAHPEYHLLGNHLLENAFALFFGAYYFGEEALLQQAEGLLLEQLNEQILSDGGHFELSPMYHSLMLFRLLDSINLLEKNPWPAVSSTLAVELRGFAQDMLAWLKAICFEDGTVPRVNDCTIGIAPTASALFAYATTLSIPFQAGQLKASGYRKFSGTNYEILVDVGQIGPDYLPGHAHADTFSFVLYYRGHPLVVDPGISTYEKNERRHLERSTQYHNTVEVGGNNQSDVWGGFRVARRAKISSLIEEDGLISGIHNGYRHLGSYHNRTFSFRKHDIEIVDEVSGLLSSSAFLHFHPSVTPSLKGNSIFGDGWKISFSEATSLELERYSYAEGYNKLIPAYKAV